MWFGCHSGNLKCQFSRCCPSARATHKKWHVERLYLRSLIFFFSSDVWYFTWLAGSILALVSAKWHRYELVSWMRFLLFSMLLIPLDRRSRQRTVPTAHRPQPTTHSPPPTVLLLATAYFIMRIFSPWATHDTLCILCRLCTPKIPYINRVHWFIFITWISIDLSWRSLQ